MEMVCPICNGMAAYILKCSVCGQQMENKGPIQDYFDDYSPYLAMDITQRVDGADDHSCVHLFFCSSCGHDKRIVIHKINM